MFCHAISPKCRFTSIVVSDASRPQSKFGPGNSPPPPADLPIDHRRRQASGEWGPGEFDPDAVELMRALGAKCGRKTWLYPLAMATHSPSAAPPWPFLRHMVFLDLPRGCTAVLLLPPPQGKLSADLSRSMWRFEKRRARCCHAAPFLVVFTKFTKYWHPPPNKLFIFSLFEAPNVWKHFRAKFDTQGREAISAHTERLDSPQPSGSCQPCWYSLAVKLLPGAPLADSSSWVRSGD